MILQQGWLSGKILVKSNRGLAEMFRQVQKEGGDWNHDQKYSQAQNPDIDGAKCQGIWQNSEDT